MKFPVAFVIPLLVMIHPVLASAASAPTNVPVRIELYDQFDTLQVLKFPATNAVLLTIADKKGSEQVAGWIAPLKERYAGRIEIRGLADVRGVPDFLRGKVRKRFQETRQHPVMMDWSGQVCERLGYAADQANVLVIRANGSIAMRLQGAASPSRLAVLCSALDEVLTRDDKAGDSP